MTNHSSDQTNFSRKITWEKLESALEEAVNNDIFDRLDMFDDDDVDVEDEPHEDGMPRILMPNINEGKAAKRMMQMTPDVIVGLQLVKRFECWIGHANFDITAKIIDKIRKAPGVEVFKPTTRYRFLIAVGKAFTSKEVFTNINNAIGITSDNNEGIRTTGDGTENVSGFLDSND